MKSCDTYRKAEACLHHYRKHLAMLDVFRAELEELRNTGDIHAQDYTGRMNTSAGNAAPVNAYTHKLLTLEHRISVLERYTAPILQHSTDQCQGTSCKF